MPKITVTSDIKKVYVDFGDYDSNPNVNTEKSTYPKTAILQIAKPYNLPYLLVNMAAGTSVNQWHVTNAENPSYPSALQIDSVDGVAPTDLDNLYNLLTDIMS